MIHEYAIDPAVVPSWVSPAIGRYFVKAFGMDSGRLVSRLPKKWTTEVWDAYNSATDLDKARLEELTKAVKQAFTQRKPPWDPSKDWVANATASHAILPYKAILTTRVIEGVPCAVDARCADVPEALWETTTRCTVSRIDKSMASLVAPLLYRAKRIVLVDPLFDPKESRWTNVLKEMLEVCQKGRPIGDPPEMEYICKRSWWGNPHDKYANRQDFETACRAELPACVPVQFCLKVVCVERGTSAQKPHNRYVLTNEGGVVFGHGLDEGDPAETDDAALLSAAQFAARWTEYAGDRRQFSEVARVTINGTRNV